ncbi:MAG: Ig-like domain-containing protein, partial [Acidobacteriota bacterium]|nr:Ig-like domain-containing protein [Acidobacteriota bacterium]
NDARTTPSQAASPAPVSLSSQKHIGGQKRFGAVKAASPSQPNPFDWRFNSNTAFGSGYGPLLVPNVSVTKTATLPNTGCPPGPGTFDVNCNGFVNPGDTLMYSVVVSNTGTDAMNVVFTDQLSADLTLIGTANASPIAVNDSYSSIGNVGITVPDGASDLLANDVDPNGNPLTITVAPTMSTQGGNVSINTTTGAFTYNPPPGFE